MTFFTNTCGYTTVSEFISLTHSTVSWGGVLGKNVGEIGKSEGGKEVGKEERTNSSVQVISCMAHFHRSVWVCRGKENAFWQHILFTLVSFPDTLVSFPDPRAGAHEGLGTRLSLHLHVHKITFLL